MALVWWPRCPRHWDYLYEYGCELLPLDEILQWEYERGTHRVPLLPAGAARLFREWTRIRDLPQQMVKAKALKEADSANR